MGCLEISAFRFYFRFYQNETETGRSKRGYKMKQSEQEMKEWAQQLNAVAVPLPAAGCGAGYACLLGYRRSAAHWPAVAAGHPLGTVGLRYRRRGLSG